VKFFISSSYGNDSCALIQWAHESGLDLVGDVYVTFIDTGWSAANWPARVASMEKWVASLGFNPVQLKGTEPFADLMERKKGFPNQQYQWCSGNLKGIPFLHWADQNDPDGEAWVLIGKRREESKDRENTPEFVEESEYHGNRKVWHAIYDKSDEGRDELLHRAGIKPLPHRSQECAPCVNANRADFLLLTEDEIQRVEDLESEVGQTMFRPKRYATKKYPNGCHGIRQVIQWARKAPLEPDEPTGYSKCSTGYCGY